MNAFAKRASSEQGSALIITLIVLLALTVVGTATVFYASQHNEVAVTARAGDQTLYYADAGIEWGLNWVTVNGLAAATAGSTNVVNLKNSGAANVQYGGAAGMTPAMLNVTIGPSFDSKGSGVVCGLVGFSTDLGAPRFQILSSATGPIGAQRSVQAHVLLPPRAGLCPAGSNVVGGYSGSH